MTEAPFEAAGWGHGAEDELGEVLRLWVGLSDDEHCLVELALVDLCDGVFASAGSWDRFVAAVVELRSCHAEPMSPLAVHALAKAKARTH